MWPDDAVETFKCHTHCEESAAHHCRKCERHGQRTVPVHVR